ncbi:MAG: ABC transporter substrate-binding protein [Planctomycetes bacterium]|nr:ABC transporter substrate-binding protein [Planctomycetota bacterium]
MKRLIGILLLLGVSCGEPDTRTVLRFLDRPDRAGGWDEVIAKFEAANPNIRVELVEGPSSTNTREEMYSTAFAAGDTTYDIVYMDVIWVSKFAAKGWLLPLDDRFPAAEREKFLPGDLQGGIYEGKLYRVPLRSDAGMLYYRKDLVENAPETFEDLVEAAKKHQKPPDLWGFVFQGQQYEGLVCAFLEILWGHGGDILNDKGEVVLDRPEAIQALTWMTGLVETISPEAVTTYQEEEARRDFQEGRAVFMRNWPYCWKLVQEADSAVRDKVGIIPMVHSPGQKSAATLGGWGFGITKTTKHPDAAWKFVSFVTAAEQQKTFHFKNGDIPSRRALFEDPDMLKANPHWPQLYKVLLAAKPRPVHPKYPQIADAIQSSVSKALIGQQKPDEALKEAAGKIRRILGR